MSDKRFDDDLNSPWTQPQLHELWRALGDEWVRSAGDGLLARGVLPGLQHWCMRSPPGVVLTAILLAILSTQARANDAAAAIAAGGVVLREDRRISMRKERLAIHLLGEDQANITRFRVAVDYEFLNETPEDVTTEVAFPVPEYDYQFDALEGPVDLGGFRAWVDGREIRVEKQVRALIDGKDYAAVLRELGIDVERHGNYYPDETHSRPGHPDQIRRLPAAAADRLVNLRLIEAAKPEPGWPRWTVAITWHWTQRFPAGKVVRIRHEYSPAAGFRYSTDVRTFVAEFPDACVDETLIRGLEARKKDCADAARRRGEVDRSMVFAAWVRYVLTTANTWKTPIRDFELVVERPEGRGVSFCWDGKVEKVSGTALSAKARDFVPAKDLGVYFFTVR